MKVGVFLLVVFGICTICYFTDAAYRESAGDSFLISCLVFDAIGVWLVVLSASKKKLIREYRRYVSYIVAEPTGSIPKIAAAAGKAPYEVRNKLERMIKRDFFVDAHIDYNTDCIVIGKARAVKPENVNVAAINMNATEKTAVRVVTAQCKYCGGHNKLYKGQAAECDYCGVMIEEK